MVNAVQRLSAIQNLATRFYDHLQTSSGVALKADLRLAIVAEAKYCLDGCNGCSDLPQTACLRPNANIFKILESLHHGTSDTMKELDTVSDETKTMITGVVHAVINHQSRLDFNWYNRTIESIAEARDILPSDIEGDKRTYLAVSAFQEIVALSVVANSIRFTELLLDTNLVEGASNFENLPTLDTIQRSKAGRSQPLYLDWTDLVKRGKPREDETKCFTPYLYKFDIKKNSPQFMKLSEQAWKEAFDLMFPMTPRFGLTMCGEDLYFVEEVSGLFYLPAEQIPLCFSDKLDDTQFCSDSFNRRDSEWIAHHVAKAHDCAF